MSVPDTQVAVRMIVTGYYKFYHALMVVTIYNYIDVYKM